MDALAIFGLQFSLSLLFFGMLTKWFLAPWLRTKPRSEALFWLTLPHAIRYLGMVFLVPGVVSPVLPSSFAIPAGYGDLAAGLLAMLVLLALRHGWAGSMALVWMFNIVGTVDLLNALSHAEIVPYLGAAWYIPTMFVPVLLITHVMIFGRLLKTAKKEATPAPLRVRVAGDNA